MAEVVAFVRLHPALFSEGAEWFRLNWHVVQAFEAVTLGLISKGRKHYSSRTILEVLRHESLLRGAEDNFKLNNNHAPDLARAFVVLYPAQVNFWEYRRDNNYEFRQAIADLTNLTFLE